MVCRRRAALERAQFSVCRFCRSSLAISRSWRALVATVARQRRRPGRFPSNTGPGRSVFRGCCSEAAKRLRISDWLTQQRDTPRLPCCASHDTHALVRTEFGETENLAEPVEQRHELGILQLVLEFSGRSTRRPRTWRRRRSRHAVTPDRSLDTASLWRSAAGSLAVSGL